MNKKLKDSEQLSRVTELLVDDIMAASDEEILAEVAEDGIDVREETRRIFLLVQEAINTHGKKKLQLMRKSYDELQNRSSKSNVHNIPLAKKKSIITSLNSNEDLRKKITMAARGENDLSEGDLAIYLENLYELGVIDEEGNIL